MLWQGPKDDYKNCINRGYKHKLLILYTRECLVYKISIRQEL